VAEGNGIFESFRERLGSLGKDYDDEQLAKIATELSALKELIDVEELHELLGTVDWPAIETRFSELSRTLLDLQKGPASDAELALAHEQLISLLDLVDEIAGVVASAHRLMAGVALNYEATRLRGWLADQRTDSNGETVDSAVKAVDASYAAHVQKMDDAGVPAEVVRQFQLACISIIGDSGVGAYPSE
jgi:type VI protein secretion system component VasK